MARIIDQGSTTLLGQLISTGVPLDVAVNGDGYIAVQDTNGAEAYTRNGSLRVTDTGLLVTSSGQPVLGEGGPITLSPYSEIMIGQDGTISIQPMGQAGAELAVIDRIKLVKPDHATVTRNERGLFETGMEEPADASVKLATETLETSNVNSVTALVTMIELSRRYETQVKLMGTAKENDESSTRLLKIN